MTTEGHDATWVHPTADERDAIKIGDTVTFEHKMHGKQSTGMVTYAGMCGLDVRIKDEIYNVYRSEVMKIKKNTK